MSTRASIIYNEKNNIHIYHEMIDDTVCLEVNRAGIEINVMLMPLSEWLELGLPNIIGLMKINLRTGEIEIIKEKQP